MKKAIVTGAAGFIGYHLCTRLLDDEIDVVGIDKNENSDRIDFIARHAGFNYVPKDIIEADLDALVKDCDAIFHLACNVKPSARWLNIEEEVEKHIHVLKKVASYANDKTKLIYVSSYDVYGKREGEISENSPKNPETLFGLIKLTEENLLKQLAEKESFPYIIVRLPTVYGPGQHDDNTYQQLISTKGDESKRKDHTVSKDSVTEDVLFVEDAAEAIYLAGKSIATNEIYNITSGTADQWQEGLKVLKASKINFNEIRKMKLKGEKAERDLGFRAKTKIKEGIQKQISYFKNKKRDNSKPI